MTHNIHMNKGFIKEILIIIIALVALKYFWHIDVVGYLSDGPVAKVLSWVGDKLHISK